MKPIRLIFALCSLAVAAAVSAQPDTRFNRAPLQPRPYAELPIGAVKPAGWLNEQLVRMRDGMTGHLDSLYPQVMGPRNGWLGGDGDVWERGPYWIDGLLPLAYILEDRRLIAKVQPWIEWALASQTADGNFGPVTRPGLLPSCTGRAQAGQKAQALGVRSAVCSVRSDLLVRHQSGDFQLGQFCL